MVVLISHFTKREIFGGKSACSPNITSFAAEKFPSGPEMAVRVCPHRGPGGFPTHGKGLGRGAGAGGT